MKVLFATGFSLLLCSCNTLVGVSRDITTMSNKVTGKVTGKEGDTFKPMIGYKDGYDPETNTYEKAPEPTN